ncbi:MAG: phosphoglycolate phosphatase [Pseudomonadota bacterium]
MHKSFPLPVKAVMIDLDGTLLDTAGDLAEAANRMLQDLGLAQCEPATVRGYIGNGVERLVKRCLTGDWQAEPDAALLARAMPIFREHYDATLTLTTRPYPGVMEGLKALRDMGVPLAVITNKAERFTLPLLKQLGLSGYFGLVLSGDSLPKKKPDPLPLTHACRHFGIAPAEMLLIGDSENDTQAARAAGCPVFCVPYGYNGGRDVAKLKPDAVVTDLLEASRLITLLTTKDAGVV